MKKIISIYREMMSKNLVCLIDNEQNVMFREAYCKFLKSIP